VSLIILATVCVKSPSRVIGLMIWQLMKQVNFMLLPVKCYCSLTCHNVMDSNT